MNYDHKALKTAIIVDRNIPVVRLVKQTGFSRKIINHVLNGDSQARIGVFVAVVNAAGVDPGVAFPKGANNA